MQLTGKDLLVQTCQCQKYCHSYVYKNYDQYEHSIGKTIFIVNLITSFILNYTENNKHIILSTLVKFR